MTNHDPNSMPPPGEPSPGGLRTVAMRYRLDIFCSNVYGVECYSGVDKGTDSRSQIPVMIYCQPTAKESQEPKPLWPINQWLKANLSCSSHLSLPRFLDSFSEGNNDYVILELPEGERLSDAWKDMSTSWKNRIQWIKQIAGLLTKLHRAGAFLRELRPEKIVISAMGQAILRDLNDLLPLPVPTALELNPSCVSAPELHRSGSEIDVRADYYHLGALLQALLYGRDLANSDFEADGRPKAYLEMFPETNPMIGQFLNKTFIFELEKRIPTLSHPTADGNGEAELLQLINDLEQHLDQVHVDVAACTNTGLVRQSNEDALSILHTQEARLEQHGHTCLLLLADGMGGSASGEIAAALAIQTCRSFFLAQTSTMGLLESDSNHREASSQLLTGMIEAANTEVWRCAQEDLNCQGMGCTLEAVWIKNKTVLAGHVGDSRLYHYRNHNLRLLTKDQTLIGKLVEFGHLTELEARFHPARSELLQAIGGGSTIWPDLLAFDLENGDWLVICSDGLTNQLTEPEICQELGASSRAEQAARRLVNRTLIKGAYDNVSVIVVRVYS